VLFVKRVEHRGLPKAWDSSLTTTQHHTHSCIVDHSNVPAGLSFGLPFGYDNCITLARLGKQCFKWAANVSSNPTPNHHLPTSSNLQFRIHQRRRIPIVPTSRPSPSVLPSFLPPPTSRWSKRRTKSPQKTPKKQNAHPLIPVALFAHFLSPCRLPCAVPRLACPSHLTTTALIQ
jgi:hypothetical protein